jgi:hypothetical protein
MDSRPSKAPRLCPKDGDVHLLQRPEDKIDHRDFTYQPLEEPLKQIRLLRFCSEAPNHDYLEISTWYLAKTPAYTAISYTWGPESTKSIVVDGHTFDIRTNCYRALRQVALHLKTEYFWIDSICINQQQPLSPEKSAQVSTMYKIYRRAYQVLACIGEQDESSEYLLALIRSIEPLLHAANKIVTPWRTERIWRSLFAALGHDVFKQIYEHMRILEQRPYWKRLWILQELYAGQTYLPGMEHAELVFLCGYDAVSIWLLRRFFVATDEGLYGRGEVADATDLPYLATALMDLRYRCKPDFATIFHHYAGTHLCADPHDQLYALVSMASAKSTASLPVIDYGRSLFDLALDVISLLEDSAQGFPASHRRVLACFQLNAFSSEVANLVNRHSRPLTKDNSMESVRKLNMSLGEHTFCTRLLDGQDESLVGVFHESGFDSYWVEWEKSIADALLEASNFQPPKQVMSGSDVAAIVCNAAESGDLIVYVGPQAEDWPWLLVLRQSPRLSTTYDVIGQGFCVNGYVPGRLGLSTKECHCDDFERAKHDTFNGDFSIRLTPEEALALTAQDFVRLSPMETIATVEWSDEDTSWDADKRFERLSVLPISSPNSAVEVKIKECFVSLSHDPDGWQASSTIAREGNSMLSLVIDEDAFRSELVVQEEGSVTGDNARDVNDMEDSDLFSISISDSGDDLWNSDEFKKMPITERCRQWQIKKYNM